jgi:hypothetical protein
MGNNHITDATLLRVVKRNANAAGIDSDPVVYDKARKALRETGAAT